VKIDLMTEVEVDVRVHVVGESPGVKEGGVLDQPMHEVSVRCLPTDVPEQIEADISKLNIGDSLRVGDLAEGANYTILEDADHTVVSIAAPISEEELEAMEAAAGVGVEEEEVPEEVEAELEEGEEAAPEEGAPAEGEGEAPPAETPATEQE
jgi:large subunit ribosomal protein L25